MYEQIVVGIRKAFAVMGFVVMFILSAAWAAYVLTVMWQWFISPNLGIPTPGMAEMYGIAIFAGLLVNDRVTKSDKEAWVIFSEQALTRAIALGLGWVAHTLV